MKNRTEKSMNFVFLLFRKKRNPNKNLLWVEILLLWRKQQKQKYPEQCGTDWKSFWCCQNISVVEFGTEIIEKGSSGHFKLFNISWISILTEHRTILLWSKVNWTVPGGLCWKYHKILLKFNSEYRLPKTSIKIAP